MAISFIMIAVAGCNKFVDIFLLSKLEYRINFPWITINNKWFISLTISNANIR